MEVVLKVVKVVVYFVVDFTVLPRGRNYGEEGRNKSQKYKNFFRIRHRGLKKYLSTPNIYRKIYSFCL